MTTLDSILKSRNITLPIKVHKSKLWVFPVVIYGCESWTVKKVERQRIDAFELRCWRRLLRVPWTVKRSNKSILKEISPEYSLEGLMLNLKFQYFGHLIQRTDSLEKTLMLGKIECRRRRQWQRWDGWMASLTQWTWVWASSGRWWRTGKPGMLQSMGSQRVGHVWATELNWMKVNRNQFMERIRKDQVQGLIRRYLPQYHVDYIKTHDWRKNKVGLNTRANTVKKKLCFMLLWFGQQWSKLRKIWFYWVVEREQNFRSE